jgi:predicted Rdx family selenoprotein
MAAADDKCDTGHCPPITEDALDWHTFTPPVSHADLPSNLLPSVVIEFCNRCRWLHRATWVQTELFLTFEDKPAKEEGEKTGKYASAKGLKSIQLVPCNAPETGGRFRVWLYREKGAKASEGEASFEDGGVVLAWDRKIRSGFPELKELKQIVRDHIAPSYDLGHSDRHDKKID